MWGMSLVRIEGVWLTRNLFNYGSFYRTAILLDTLIGALNPSLGYTLIETPADKMQPAYQVFTRMSIVLGELGKG